MQRNYLLLTFLVLAIVTAAAVGAIAVYNHQAVLAAQAEISALEGRVAHLNNQLDAVADARSRALTDAPVEPVAAPEPAPAVEGDAAPPAELALRDETIVALRREIAELRDSQPAETADPAPTRDPRAAWTNRMQAFRNRMREQNPEEYERRRQEGQERLDALAALTRERTEFMKTVPTEGLAPEYLENHLALLERMEFFQQAMATMAADPESPETMELMPRVFTNLRGLDEMLRMQREVLLDDMARDIGYDNDAARQFVETVNYITEATTMPSPMMFRQGRGQRPDRRPPADPMPAMQQ